MCIRDRAEAAKRREESEADRLGRADQALPAGTRVCIAGRGRGAYVRFGKKTFGANEHTIAFDSGETVTLTLKGRRWTVKEAEMDAMEAEMEAPAPAPAPARAPRRA